MKPENLRDKTDGQLIDMYWEKEIEVTSIANQNGYSTDGDLIANNRDLPVTVRDYLGKTLWDIVHILHEYNQRKRRSHLVVIDGGKR